MTTPRVLRWEVHVDGEWHWIGAGQVAHVAARTHDERPGDLVEVWTIEETPDPAEHREQDTTYRVPMRPAIVVGTGHLFPVGAEHLGTAIVPTLYLAQQPDESLPPLEIRSRAGLVWHVFGVREGFGVTLPPGIPPWKMEP